MSRADEPYNNATAESLYSWYKAEFLENGAVMRRVTIVLIGLLPPTLIIGWLGLRELQRYSLAGRNVSLVRV